MRKLILTVCKGNIHRSVIAALCIEKVIKGLNLESEYEIVSRGLQGSAGTNLPLFLNIKSYPTESLLMTPSLAEIEIEIPPNQIATPVTEEIVSKASLILAMDQAVLCSLPYSLVNQFPNHGFKMRLFQELAGITDDVTDCAGETNAEIYRKVNLTISSISQNHITTILKLVDIFSAYTNKENLS